MRQYKSGCLEQFQAGNGLPVEQGGERGFRFRVFQEFPELPDELSRSPGMQDVIDEDEVAVIYAERQLRRLHHGVHADTGEVITVERDIEAAQRVPDPEPAVQLLRDPDTGEVLDEDMTQIATLEATEVKEKLAICSVTSGDAGAIAKGMAIHLP